MAFFMITPQFSISLILYLIPAVSEGKSVHRSRLMFVKSGEYEWAIDDQPAKTLKVGDTFYEPTGCLHRVSKNPSAKDKARVLAVVLHPRDAKQIAVPEPHK